MSLNTGVLEGEYEALRFLISIPPLSDQESGKAWSSPNRLSSGVLVVKVFSREIAPTLVSRLAYCFTIHTRKLLKLVTFSSAKLINPGIVVMILTRV